VLSLGYDPDTGKRIQKWITVHGTRAEADRQLRVMLTGMDRGKPVTSSDRRLGAFLEDWLRDYAQPNLNPRTTEDYASKIRSHLIPALGDIPLDKLTARQIQALYASLMISGNLQKPGPLSATTIRHLHMILHKALATAMEWGILSGNPADSVRPPRTERVEMHTWNKAQMLEFLEATRQSQVYSPYYPVFHILLYTAVRRSEALALRWKDIDLSQGRISISRGLHQLHDGSLVFSRPKTKSGLRSIEITATTVAILAEHCERHRAYRLMLGADFTPDDLAFCQPDGQPTLPGSVSHAWTKMVKLSGLPRIRLHDARHTHASLLLEQNVHPKIVQERLGHASIQTTLDTYSHVTPGMQREAMKLFDEKLTDSANPYQFLPLPEK
jgi:integrase